MRGRRKCSYLLTALVCYSSTVRAPVPRIGVSFSPAGLLTPFHLGASEQLQKLGILTSECAISGASGGALAAVVTALQTSNSLPKPVNVDPLESAMYIAKQCRDHGPRGTLRTALDEILEKTLPPDAHHALNRRPGPCTISFTSLSLTSLSPQLVNVFESREDVMDCLRASCNIPFYFNGNKLWTEARGKRCIDGFFAVDFNRFGCPPTGASTREIIVCPFKASVVKLNPWKARGQNSDVEFDLITPDLLDRDWWPFTAKDLLLLALDAPTSRNTPGQLISDHELESIYGVLFKAGQEAVRRWHRTKSW